VITDPLFYVLAIPVVLMVGISKTGIPGLFGGMGVPLLALVISPFQAAAIMLPVLFFGDLMGLKPFWGVYDRRNLPILLVGVAIGAVLGTVTFGVVTDAALRLLVGVIAVSFALNSLFGPGRNRPQTSASWPRGVFWSSLSGYTSFLIHSGAAPLMTYLLPQRIEKRLYVGTTVWFYFAANCAKVGPYVWFGQLDAVALTTAAVLLPLMALGVWLGLHVQGRLNERLFYRISYWSLLGIGVKLVYDGVVQT
jgi:uncharacterized membrane protein YfcA